MRRSLPEAGSRQCLARLQRSISNEYKGNDLGLSATIFSPHPDDETLGCGGTIFRKGKVGADMTIVFMTDGEGSHRHLIPEEKLRSMREDEAIAAGRILGLGESDIVFLRLRRKELGANQSSAVHGVKEILSKHQPDEIFIPYQKESHPDHSATNSIVRAALKGYGRKAIINEYPIWFWLHWPWVSLGTDSWHRMLRSLGSGLLSGLRLLMHFRYSSYIGDVLEVKRAALDQYKSQMTRLIPDPRWRTLADVSNGEFLECFFQDHEVLHRYNLEGEGELEDTEGHKVSFRRDPVRRRG